MSKLLSPAWLWFERDPQNPNTQVKCQCGKIFQHKPKGPTTSLIRHINEFHNKEQMPKLEMKQTKITDQIKSKTNSAILRYIINCMIPISTVDKEEFKELFSSIGSNYLPPCRQTLTKKILNAYQENKKYVYEKINNEAISISVTTDGWTSIAKQCYYSLTAHYLTKDFIPSYICLDIIHITGPHTSENLSKLIFDKQKELLKVPILSATTDNAANMILTISKAFIPNHINCAAHTIQLSIKPFLEKHFPDLLEKLHNIVGHFSHSPQAREEFENEQLIAYGKEWKSIHLIQDIVTRWNSTYDMIGKKYKY